jgi:hypothetical protein
MAFDQQATEEIMMNKKDTDRGSKALAEIISLPASVNYNPQQALASLEGFGDRLTDVMVIGYVDGDLVCRSSRLSRAEALWLLEHAKDWAMYGEAE